MKTLIVICFILFSSSSFGQRPTNITGKLIDENGKPVHKATISYGDSDYDTIYTNKLGIFKLSVPYPARFWHLYIDRKGFLPKYYTLDIQTNDTILKESLVLRSRKGFYYDLKLIDSTHLGITVNEAIERYKLDSNMCIVWDEPPGKYFWFTTEMSDSSYACFVFQGLFTRGKRVKINDILDRKIIGIGFSFTDGTEKIIGNGFTRDNPYFVERQIKNKN